MKHAPRLSLPAEDADLPRHSTRSSMCARRPSSPRTTCPARSRRRCSTTRSARGSARSTSRSRRSTPRSSARRWWRRTSRAHLEEQFAGQAARLAAAGLLLARRQALAARWPTSCARSAGMRGASKAATRPTAQFIVDTLSTLPAAVRLSRDPRHHRQRQEPAAARAARRRRAGARPRGPRRAPRLGARPPARPPATVAEDVRDAALGRPARVRSGAAASTSKGESKKIGQLQVPEALMHAMRASECVLLEAGRDTRIALLSDEYRHYFADPRGLYAQLDCLHTLYGSQGHRRLEGACRARRMGRAGRAACWTTITTRPTGARPLRNFRAPAGSGRFCASTQRAMRLSRSWPA